MAAYPWPATLVEARVQTVSKWPHNSVPAMSCSVLSPAIYCSRRTVAIEWSYPGARCGKGVTRKPPLGQQHGVLDMGSLNSASREPSPHAAPGGHYACTFICCANMVTQEVGHHVRSARRNKLHMMFATCEIPALPRTCSDLHIVPGYIGHCARHSMT